MSSTFLSTSTIAASAAAAILKTSVRLSGFMPYSIVKTNGKFAVVSPKGKTWKTKYATEAAAQKGIDYISGRFNSSPTSSGDSSADAPPELDMEARGSHTLQRMGDAQDEEGF